MVAVRRATTTDLAGRSERVNLSIIGFGEIENREDGEYALW